LRDLSPRRAFLVRSERNTQYRATAPDARVDYRGTNALPMNPRVSPGNGELTALLRSWSDGDEHAFDQLLPLVYDELHRMALRYLSGERSHGSLQPTALVNEVCLRLLGWDQVRWQNRGHFFGVSAQMMRRVLVDIARKRQTQRRGGGEAVRIPLEDVEIPADDRRGDLVALDEALERLAVEDPRKARVVELRFFGGLSLEEAAEAIGISIRTAQNDWAFARAWLYRALTEGRRA
jgi:RNA polymerase sigma-70 factor, ECF subfamily